MLSGVNLAVPHGGRLALVGPNGAGKTTLLRVLAGLDRAKGGDVLLDGQVLATMTSRERARHMAVVSQNESPPADLLVHELVSLGRLPHRSPWERERTYDHERRALERLGLDDLIDRPVDRLSGGELRRVLIARAIAQEAAVLMLDEPTNHLDLRHQHDVLRTVRDLGVTVVAAIHDLDLVLHYFDEVAVVGDGGIAALGDPALVLTSDVMPAVFGVRTVRVVHPESGRVHLLSER